MCCFFICLLIYFGFFFFTSFIFMVIHRGAFKHKAAAHENKDDPNAAARHTIRTPKALVEFGGTSCSSAAWSELSSFSTPRARRNFVSFLQERPSSDMRSVQQTSEAPGAASSAMVTRGRGAAAGWWPPTSSGGGWPRTSLMMLVLVLVCAPAPVRVLALVMQLWV